ncbi:MAG TPA: hypothetical protein VGG29_16770 [Caulobacteraceae bacterium]|jgi:hypothetical protein
MSDILPPRPTFSNGQYIGADDLNAAVDYARDETRRLALSSRNWGIVTGLALVERTDAAGAVQMYVEPGIAWDGYGRPVVVLAPAPVTPDLFADLKSGNQVVWLRYSALDERAIEAGFRTCGHGDPITRVAETYAIVAGRESVGQQSDGVDVGGASVADPADMLIAVDQAAPAVLDAAAAHQVFQDDDARWLIPVGVAAYVAGAPGSFAHRSAAQLVQDRLARRYVGVVAEQLLAADGVLRLRDRLTDQAAGETDDDFAKAAAVGEDDVEPNTAGRLVGTELVWVEGKLRVTDDARIWGARLEFRNAKGREAGHAPLFARRGTSAGNSKGGQDLQVAIGSATGTAGKDRFTIGVIDAPTTAQPDGVLDERMVVRSDGRAAIGTNEIDGYDHNGNQLVVASQNDAGVTVVSDATSSGHLFFAHGTGATAQKAGFLTYDHGSQLLTLGANAQTVMSLTGGAQVAIGPADPTKYLSDANQLVVSSDGGAAGITIVGEKGTTARLNFADGDATPNAGFIRYDLANKRMELGADSEKRVWLDDQGRVGVGTETPRAPIEVGSDVNDHALLLDLDSVQALAGSNATTLRLNPQGGNVGVGLTSPIAALQVRAKSGDIGLIVDDANGTALRAADGKVSIGFGAGAQTTLDVRSDGGSTSQNIAAASAHVAFFENTNPQTGPVLALQIDGALAGYAGDATASDYVNCLDGGGNWLGGVEGGTYFFGSFATWVTAGGDYAEAVPRADGQAAIKSGSVVGVKDGRVSLATDGADAVLLTTSGPSVLGKAPPRGQRAAYEIVAMLGQVTVTVSGGARAGDLILPSGKGDGLGRAAPADEVSTHELTQVIGQAWATAPASADGTAQVNTLVGPGVATAAVSAALLRRQAHEIARLAAEVSALKAAPRSRPAKPRA